MSLGFYILATLTIAGALAAVLLKNEGGLLPLEKTIGTLAVIGPNANEHHVSFSKFHLGGGDPPQPATKRYEPRC